MCAARASYWAHRPPDRPTHRSNPHTPIRRAAAQAEAAKLAPHDAQTGAERGEARDGTTRRTRPWTARR
eukprot:scaffold15322_cov37-Phaeocystis_antarctica.AAC.2